MAHRDTVAGAFAVAQSSAFAPVAAGALGVTPEQMSAAVRFCVERDKARAVGVQLDKPATLSDVALRMATSAESALRHRPWSSQRRDVMRTRLFAMRKHASPAPHADTNSRVSTIVELFGMPTIFLTINWVLAIRSPP